MQRYRFAVSSRPEAVLTLLGSQKADLVWHDDGGELVAESRRKWGEAG